MHKSPSCDVGANSKWPPENDSNWVGLDRSVGHVKKVASLEIEMGAASDNNDAIRLLQKKRPRRKSSRFVLFFIILRV